MSKKITMLELSLKKQTEELTGLKQYTKMVDEELLLMKRGKGCA
jgi:hypothetical protein